MLIAIRKNKAPQTLEVRGSVDNALEAALSEVLDFRDQYARACARELIITNYFRKLQFIIAKNLLKTVFYSNNLLGFGVGVGYSAGKCFKTRLLCGNRNRHTCGFFTSIDFTLWADGFIREDKAHGTVRVLNIRPPFTLQNVTGGIVKQSHCGVNQ